MTIVRVAVTADLHCTRFSQGAFQALFAGITEAADLLLIAGDLTDHGEPDETHVLVRELSSVRIPVVVVLGNHDFESGKEAEVGQILKDAGVKVLDGDACEVLGIGIAGVKGFCGGFGQRALAPWGESVIKLFAREAVEEALKLEKALTRLRTEHLIALLHYSPVQQTVDGEPPEIYPFLGSSRLEEPLNRYPVSCVFHGHAHQGQSEGRTSTGVPVYNVSMPLLTRTFAGRLPFRVFNLTVQEHQARHVPAADHAPAPPLPAPEATANAGRGGL